MADIIKLQENLKKLGYEVSYFETSAEATAYLAGKLAGKTVGIGGSMTIREMGLYEAFANSNTQIVSHWNGNTAREAMQTPIYLSSVNGVAETGELINIDGTGNRVASTIYGHEELYFIFGVNKVEETFEKALWRARNIAAPKNAQRLERKTPCAVNGDKCYNCSSPERICRAMSVHWGPTKGFKRVEVVIINEALGM